MTVELPVLRRIGLLIDTEGAEASCADALMQDLAGIGQVACRLAFGDFKLTQSEPWSVACLKHGIREIQFDQSPAGKNTADVALVVFAMDLLHQHSIDALALVASDTDYLALVNRFAAEDLPVFLYGRKHTPDRLCDAVTRFVHLENLRRGHPANTAGSRAKTIRQPRDFMPLLSRLANELHDPDGWISIQQLHDALLDEDRHFDCRDYGYRHLVDLCVRHPHCVAEQPADGPVRFRISRKGASNQRKAAKRRDRAPT